METEVKVIEQYFGEGQVSVEYPTTDFILITRDSYMPHYFYRLRLVKYVNGKMIYNLMALFVNKDHAIKYANILKLELSDTQEQENYTIGHS